MTDQTKSNITVIILTFNEEQHIARCIELAKKYSDDIYVVDSFSTDKTVEIAKSLNVFVLQNKFISHGEQVSWALENIDFKTEWILRLDADEYLEEDLILEIKNKLPKLSNDIGGINLKRKVIFMNKWIKYGGRYPVIIIRLWKKGHGQMEYNFQDEHLFIKKGRTVTFKNNFCDHNLKNLSSFVQKHDWYAGREALDIILNDLKKRPEMLNRKNTSLNISIKRFLKKNFYNKLPVGRRSLLYFIYRYFILLGFLDGKEGLIYHFLQGFWYRSLVDIKLIEYRKEIKNIENYDEIIKKLSSMSNIKLK